MSLQFEGIPAAPGLCKGKAVVLTQEKIEWAGRDIGAAGVDNEISRFARAVEIAVTQLEDLSRQVASTLGEAEAEIIGAQSLMASDPGLAEDVTNRISQELVSAENAVQDACEEQAKMLEGLGDEYLAARAADMRDVGRRILAILTGATDRAALVGNLEPDTVIVADDLAPSETAAIDVANIAGIVLDGGGRTSHTAILARSMGIPAVMGLGNATGSITSGDLVLVDGNQGHVQVNPEPGQLSKFGQAINLEAIRKRELSLLKNLPGVTADGHHVELASNIGGAKEVSLVQDSGSDGVGLFRTEFLFIDRNSAPSEDEQFEIYKEVLSELAPKPIVIRTLDAGGDKDIPYLGIPAEANPFLGLRAIRLCLQEKGLFRSQLRALLRASSFGTLRIMFPMVADIHELRAAKREYESVKAELESEGITVADNVQVGIMVEVPSAAMQADVLAAECDFFSIGTNDLVQYTMACDRGNPAVSYLSDPFYPAVLRLIARTIEEGHRKGIWVGMCGEMAGMPPAVPLLVGMGIDELSMAPASVPRAKEIIRNLSYEDAKGIWHKVRKMADRAEIRSYLEGLVEIGE
ncbi:MAG TPA: phosphoenolpyruvate--protein phosphotransferase [Firmicutes bacterium]|nr:phosphoenolpyruvate--protein phosphotransferase [Candidatus Fermentithermobacillaceae bacterium]